MFAVIYSFQTHPGKEQQFIAAWKTLTEFIYKYENSLGSRLHASEDPQTWIAYAQWPDRATWQNSGDKLPPEAAEARQAMREACHTITTLHKLEWVEDLLETHTFPSK